MFLLVCIEDKVKIAPDQFDLDPTQALIDQIELKFSNKVLLEVGLCICFYDFLDVGDPYVYPAEGCCHQQVRFRLVVFRPFVGEVITAKVVSSTISGLRVSMGFFDDVIIPSHLLQQPSEYSESTGQWVWRYGEDEDAEFSICIGDEIRFRVRTVTFGSDAPVKGPPSTANAVDSSTSSGNDNGRRTASSAETGAAAGAGAAVVPALQLVGCINEDGLGLLSWWSAS